MCAKEAKRHVINYKSLLCWTTPDEINRTKNIALIHGPSMLARAWSCTTDGPSTLKGPGNGIMEIVRLISSGLDGHDWWHAWQCPLQPTVIPLRTCFLGSRDIDILIRKHCNSDGEGRQIRSGQGGQLLTSTSGADASSPMKNYDSGSPLAGPDSWAPKTNGFQWSKSCTITPQ